MTMPDSFATIPRVNAAAITDILSRDEIRDLTRTSNLRGALSVAVTWGVIAGAMALAAWRPGVVTIGVALVLIGGRQLALAILMHECSHRSLFRTRWLNDVIGEWLCAAPVWQHLDKYRKHHIAHHTHTGTERDPDMGLVDPFPVTTGSLARKFARDLTGLSGAKRIYGLLAMDFGYIEYTAAVGVVPIDQTGRTKIDVAKMGARNLAPVVATNAALAAILVALGHGWLYALWAVAWMTTFSLIIRIRSMAEHACTEKTDDQYRNTRTTAANPLARLTVAPHHVNFHLEHHALMTVPHYRLRGMHRLLRARGVYETSPYAPGYGTILKLVTTKAG